MIPMSLKLAEAVAKALRDYRTSYDEDDVEFDDVTVQENGPENYVVWAVIDGTNVTISVQEDAE